MPTMVAATVSSGIASELTMLAVNLAFSRQSRRGSSPGGFSASCVTNRRRSVAVDVDGDGLRQAQEFLLARLGCQAPGLVAARSQLQLVRAGLQFSHGLA